MQNIAIVDLLPTQSSLRNFEAVESMKQYVCGGGFFTKTAIEQHQNWPHRHSLIAIARFEDDLVFIRDGHHRVLAIWLAERDYLVPDEYVLENWYYEDFTELSENSVSKGWDTPFDPRTEIRLGDFLEFKKMLPKDVHERIQVIRNNKSRYCEARNDNHKHIISLAGNLIRGCSC